MKNDVVVEVKNVSKVYESQSGSNRVDRKSVV